MVKIPFRKIESHETFNVYQGEFKLQGQCMMNVDSNLSFNNYCNHVIHQMSETVKNITGIHEIEELAKNAIRVTRNPEVAHYLEKIINISKQEIFEAELILKGEVNGNIS